MLSNQVRQTFIDFFVRNGHRAVKSSSLIPYGDNTILFTNAGMNQFKNAFLGLEKRDYNRAVTAQKVMRVSGKHNDLENIGFSKRHHTFFEMLGNFSLGDYFKPEAMGFSLELLEKEYGFERDRLWFTIYKDDDESFELWQKHGIAPDRILRFGEKDNFWSMGATGPCGPNSEIHYYTGDKKSDNLAKWVNNDEDDTEKTVEIWNNVFMQFNRTEDGVLHPLPQTGVDTGMGFERLCRLLQGKEHNYQTDLFAPILERTQQLAMHSTEQREELYVPYRIVADHVRSAVFLIGDGVLPGNAGRNYVLRMIMRRAMRFGRKLGFEGPFLHQVAPTVIDVMGGHYTELVDRRAHILKTIAAEEDRFERTLDLGLVRLDEIFAKMDGDVVPGADAFRLYDTFGLPIEITRDIAKEKSKSVDEAGFEAVRAAASARNREASTQFTANFEAAEVYPEFVESMTASGALPKTGVAYNPYGALSMQTRIAGILLNGEETDRVVPGDTFEVVLADTPLYVESGGQVSDSGLIKGDGFTLKVSTVRRPMPGLIVHVCEALEGEADTGAACTVSVDAGRRASIQRNHTTTHILQWCLRQTLGDLVGQQGSSVDEHRLRFDFSYGTAMTADELNTVGALLNQAILDNTPVGDAQMSYDAAIKSGAMAFFSEKYGDVVRVVDVGGYSKELCGGTHVNRTGDIGSALIVSESSVSGGVRRIEVLTGAGAQAHANDQARQLAEIGEIVNASGGDVAAQTRKLAEQLKETQKQLDGARRDLARVRFEGALASAAPANGSTIMVARVDAESNDLLREMSDWVRERHPSNVTVLASVINEKPAILVAVSQDLVKKGVNAGALIKDIASVVGGSGGGRPNLAQAGGKDAHKIDDALTRARQLVGDTLSQGSGHNK
jgi:alanyl-tRNA synthetase